MADIVVLGAGLGGIPMALEMKMRSGVSEPYYELALFKALGIDKLKTPA